MKLTTRQLAVTGILGAVAVLLSVTPLGYIPIPTPAGSATIMHIPVIIGAVLEGAMVGSFIGLIFGITSFLRGVNFFVDPIVAIIPRVLIGIFAAYSYKLLNSKTKATVLAAVVGTLTNTFGVLILAVMRGYLVYEVALGIAVGHGIPEVIVAVLVVGAIIKVFRHREGVKN